MTANDMETICVFQLASYDGQKFQTVGPSWYYKSKSKIYVKR